MTALVASPAYLPPSSGAKSAHPGDRPIGATVPPSGMKTLEIPDMQYETLNEQTTSPGPEPGLAPAPAPLAPHLPGEPGGNTIEGPGAPGAPPSAAPGSEAGGPTFAAIDFETADYQRDSACSIGVAIVRDGSLVQSVHRLIRPPRQEFLFTWLHGLAWEQVADAPPFGSVWREIEPLLEGVDFLAAHNAGFDRSVLAACSKGCDPPLSGRRFVCSMRVARKVWGIHPTRLSDVCARLDIPLNHHHALSDAEACARILLAATAKGWRPPDAETLPQPVADGH